MTPCVHFRIIFYANHLAHTIFCFVWTRGFSMRSVCYEIKFDFLWSKNFLISTRREFWLEIKFLFREDARNLHMIRNFYLKIRFLRRVNDFFDLQKKGDFNKFIPILSFFSFFFSFSFFSFASIFVHFR